MFGRYNRILSIRIGLFEMDEKCSPIGPGLYFPFAGVMNDQYH
jgi:hypothetical protein